MAAISALLLILMVCHTPATQAGPAQCIKDQLVQGLKDNQTLTSLKFSPFVYGNARACFRLSKLKQFSNCLRGIFKLHQAIEPRSYIHVHSTHIAEILSHPQFPGRFERFKKGLKAAADASAKDRIPQDSVWDIALNASDGNREDAIDLMMLFINDDTSSSIIPRLKKLGVGNADTQWKDIQATRERIDWINRRALHESNGKKNFGFPNFEGSDYHEAYHFWEAASWHS